MKPGGLLFIYGAVFYTIVAAVYGVWSKDWIGTTALVFLAAMAGLAGFYIVYTAKRLAERPEEDGMANQDEADPDYGFYSPHSWWPLPMGAAAAMIALGFIFATWLMLAGIVFLMISIVGLVFEYYRGDFAH